MSGARTLVVGGLGWPHDELAAAALVASGMRARPLGALDADALERGRSVLPRGQCAPMLYLTGAITRLAAGPSEPADVLALQSCGPCRYALFAPEWRRQLDTMGRTDLRIAQVGQHALELTRWLAGASRELLDALVVADAVVETARRLAPYAEDPDEVDREARALSGRIAERVARGVPPIRALREERGWHAGLRRAPLRALGRAVVIGEPWSLHVDGDGQLHLPRALARAGVEVEMPPASLWLEYLLWQASAPPFGRALVDASTRDAAERLRGRLRDALAAASDAAGLAAFVLDDVAELEELAAPYVSSSIRGGYGHVEIGLAVRARVERRAHVVLSLRSFGCVPSAGITDGILPAALAGELDVRDEDLRRAHRDQGAVTEALAPSLPVRPERAAVGCAVEGRAAAASFDSALRAGSGRTGRRSFRTTETRPLAFLSLEVCGDGEAARESRLSLRVAAVLDAAEDELREVCAARGLDEASARAISLDPLRGRTGPQRYACTLASAVAAQRELEGEAAHA